MLADEPRERVFELVQLAFVNQKMDELGAEFGGNRVDRAQQGFAPFVGSGALEGLQGLFVLRRGHLFQQLAQLQTLRPDGRLAQLPLRRCQARRFAQLAADKHRLQRERRLRAQMTGNFVVQHAERFGDRGGFVTQIGKVFQQFMGDRKPRLQTFRRAIIAHQPFLQ